MPASPRALLAPLVLGLTTLFFGPGASANAPERLDRTRVVVDHRDGSVRVGGKPMEDGDEVRVRVSSPVVVQVVHTNTALYAYEVSAEKVEAREIAGLRSFLGALGPYSVEAVEAAVRSTGFPGPPERSAAPPEEALGRLDALIAGLRHTETKVLASLEEMSRGTDVDQAAARLRTALGAEFQPFDVSEDVDACGSPRVSVEVRLKAVTELLAVYEELSGYLRQGTGGPLPGAETARETMKKALEEAPQVLGEAYRVEALAQNVASASGTWCGDPIPVGYSTARKMVIAVAPRAAPELGRLAARSPIVFSLTAQPDWLARPAVGLAFLASPRSTYPVYSTRESGDRYEIVQSDLQDSRFTYGLSLGLTWRGLDRRDDRGFAVMVPEFTVNPSDDVKAMGVGVGLTLWRYVKVGAGALWTRHKALDGQAPGDVLEEEGDLRLKDAYGKPKFYFSVSVVGWPPFVEK